MNTHRNLPDLMAQLKSPPFFNMHRVLRTIPIAQVCFRKLANPVKITGQLRSVITCSVDGNPKNDDDFLLPTKGIQPANLDEMYVGEPAHDLSTSSVKKFSSVFDMTLAENHLCACLGYFGPKMNKLFRDTSRDNLSTEQYQFYYDFDKLTYSAILEICCSYHGTLGNHQMAATLFLSNNAFFYDAKSNVALHNSNKPNWGLQATQNDVSSFPKALTFAQDMMQCGDITPHGQINYHSDAAGDQAMDIKFHHNKSIISIRCTPGGPIHDFDDELWT